MGKLKVKYEIRKKYKAISQLIEQHGKVRIVFNETFYDKDIDHWVGYGSYRRRIVGKDGYSKVSYKGVNYTKWSGYSRSCFISGMDVKNFKETLKLMYRHDSPWIQPIEVHYGWFFKKKVIL